MASVSAPLVLLFMSVLFSENKSQFVRTYDNKSFVCKGSSCVESNKLFCGKYEQNRTCQCDALCAVFKDCCYDYIHTCVHADDTLEHDQVDNSPTENIDSGMTETTFNGNMYTCVVTHRLDLHHFGAYWMVTVCSGNDKTVHTEQLLSFCQNASLFQHSLIYSLPVTSIADGITFRNVFCALCNGKSVNDVKPWVLESDDDVFDHSLTINPDETPKSLNQFLRNNNGSYQYIPLDYYQVRKCLPLSHSVVQTCPNDAQESQRNACRDYLGPGFYFEGGQLYRNWHCAICNLSFLPQSKLPCEEPPVPLSSSTLFILVQFDGSRTEVSDISAEKYGELSGTPSCGKGYIGDPFTLQCISIFCLEKYELKGDICIRKSEEGRHLNTSTQSSSYVNCTSGEQIASFQLRPCEMNLTFVTTVRYELTKHTTNVSNNIRRLLNSDANHVTITGYDFKFQYLYSKVECTFKNAVFHTQFVINDAVELNLVDFENLTTISITMYYLTVETFVNEFIHLNSTNININWYNASSISINFVQICNLVMTTNYDYQEEGYRPCQESFDDYFNFNIIRNLTKRTLFVDYYYALAVQTLYFGNDSMCASQRKSICYAPLNQTCATVIYNQSEFLFDDLNNSMTHITTQKVLSRESFQLTHDGALYVCSESLDTASFNATRSFNDDNRFLELSQTMVWINFVGTLSSVVGLIMTIAFRCTMAPLRNLPGKMIMQISVALILGQCLVLCEHLARSDPRLCTSSAVFLHYIWLAVFFWQNAFAIEAWHGLGMQKLKMRYTERSPRKCIAYSCYGWGFPAFIVIVCLILHHKSTVRFQYGDVRISCWILDNRANLFAFGLPIAIIVIINFVLFILIIHSIHKTRTVVQHVAGCTAFIKLFQREIIIYIKLSSIMGFTWIFAFVAAFTHNMFAVFLFILLNSSQGVFIFIAFNCNETASTVIRKNAKLLVCLNAESTDDNMTVSRTRNNHLAPSVRPTDLNIIKLQPVAETGPGNAVFV